MLGRKSLRLVVAFRRRDLIQQASPKNHTKLLLRGFNNKKGGTERFVPSSHCGCDSEVAQAFRSISRVSEQFYSVFCSTKGLFC